MGGLAGLPAEMFEAIKDNVIVQWVLIVIFILIMGTQTAEKLSGPVGKFARWVRSFGEARENREAEERRARRQKMLSEATEGQEFLARKMAGLESQVGELFEHRDAMDRLINAHMGWDYMMQQDAISRGVPPESIPTPPPLRVPWGTPTRSEKASAQAQTDIEAARGDDAEAAATPG